MRWFRALIWIGTVTLGVFMFNARNQPTRSDFGGTTKITDNKMLMEKYIHFDVKQITFKDPRHHPTMLEGIFILFYVLALINTASNEMNSQRYLWLNNLLRLNLPAAVLAGIADVADNYLNQSFGSASLAIIGPFDLTPDKLKYILIVCIALVIVISMGARFLSFLIGRKQIGQQTVPAMINLTNRKSIV